MNEATKMELKPEEQKVKTEAETEKETEIVEVVFEKPYEFRKLASPDVFPMFNILSKIGINEFTECFGKDSVQDLIASFTEVSTEETEQEATHRKANLSTVVGVSVVLEVANVIFKNIHKCEKDIYSLLSQTSNLSVEEIKALEMTVFAEMIIDFIKKEEFGDFIKVVSRLFK